MKIAIVILNWNGKKLLQQFLPSVLENSTENTTIYVADNASTDDSIAYVTTHFPTVKIIKNKENGGYAKGYNDALKNLKEDIFCLMNSDVEVTKNWLPPILERFSNCPEVGIIQPKLLDYKQKDSFEYAGAAGGFLDFFGYPYCRGRIFNTLEKDDQQYQDTATIFWASGACFFIRRAIFEAVKGFDEDYFAHQEEIDLCWRVKNLGHEINYVGAATIFHVGGATLAETHPKKTFLNFRNSLFNIVKNVPVQYCFLVIFSRLLLDGIAAVKFLTEGKPKHTFAILKAHLSFYAHLPLFLQKRKNISKQYKYYALTSIVWQYFILGRKKYTDLKMLKNS